jgi:protein-arginine kinase activator protein McsA
MTDQKQVIAEADGMIINSCDNRDGPRMRIIKEIQPNGRIEIKCLKCGHTFTTFKTTSRYWCPFCLYWADAQEINAQLDDETANEYVTDNFLSAINTFRNGISRLIKRERKK